MGLRLTASDAVNRALDASWIIAVGVSKDDGAAAVTTLLDDAVANGAFAFLRQDTATNNTPHEPTPYQSPRADLVGIPADGCRRRERCARVATDAIGGTLRGSDGRRLCTRCDGADERRSRVRGRARDAARHRPRADRHGRRATPRR